jgi:hypothetical protein
MKTKKTDLEVDFIGGQGSLTLAEEKALNEYFKKHKLTPSRKLTKALTRKTKETA